MFVWYGEPIVSHFSLRFILLLMFRISGCSGSDLVLSSRLDLFKGAQKRSNPPYQLDYLVVVDFEATCEANRRAGSYEQEIIEFPAVLICISSKTIVSITYLLVMQPCRGSIGERITSFQEIFCVPLCFFGKSDFSATINTFLDHQFEECHWTFFVVTRISAKF